MSYARRAASAMSDVRCEVRATTRTAAVRARPVGSRHAVRENRQTKRDGRIVRPKVLLGRKGATTRAMILSILVHEGHTRCYLAAGTTNKQASRETETEAELTETNFGTE